MEEHLLAFDIDRLPLVGLSVFLDRADVKRKLEIPVEAAGRVRVTIERMSAMLDENSIRVDGGTNAKILEVAMKKKTVFHDPRRQAKQEELQGELKRLLSQEQEFKGELERAKEQRAIFVNTIQFQANQQPLDKLQQFLDRQTPTLRKMDENVSQIRSKLQQTQEQLKEVKSEMEGMKITAARWCLTILLDIAAPGRAELTLTYALFSVSWSASYEFKVDSANHSMEMIYFGAIRQNTGETWCGVNSTLISARYGVELGQLPTLVRLKAVTLEEKKPITAAASSVAVSSAQSTSQTTSTVTGESDRSVDVEIESENENAHFTFECFADHVPSDGEEHRVVMLTKTLPVELSYECVPRLVPFAFAKMAAVNSTGFPLLPGQLFAYMDNCLVACSSLPKVINLRERFECSLGVDPRIRVTHKETTTTGLSGGSMSFFGRTASVTTFEERTTIKNNRRAPIMVKLVDVIPRSGDDSVKVTLIEPSTEMLYTQMSTVRQGAEEGWLVWDLYVGPGKDAKAVVKYTVTCPSGKTIKLTDK